MSIPKEVIDRASYTDLIAFCQSRGIALKREGSEFVVKGNDSLYISTHEPYKWYRHSTGEGGKAIDFCVKYLGMTFQQAVEELTGASLPSVTVKSTRQQGHNIIDVSDNQKRVIAYLCKRRFINYQIVIDLIKDGKLHQDKNGNCVFIINDFHGNVVGAELHGTGDTRFKGQANHQDGFGFCVPMGDSVQTIAFFESAIDLISFYQIYLGKVNNALLVSMGGLKPVVLENYRSRYPDAQVVLCVDNDDKGRMFARQYRYRYIITNCKDWNEKLSQLGKKIN